MHNIFVPKGRINRSHFWGYIFMLLIWELCMYAITPSHSSYIYYNKLFYSIIGHAIYYIVKSVQIWCVACLMVQRLHDMNRPLEHLLYILVPVYNLYFLWCILFRKGMKGPNKYGDDPLESAHEHENTI